MDVWQWVEAAVEAADLAAGLAAVTRLPVAEEQDRRQQDRHEAMATIDLHGKDLLPVFKVMRVETSA
jgi:hypothetical protein